MGLAAVMALQAGVPTAAAEETDGNDVERPCIVGTPGVAIHHGAVNLGLTVWAENAAFAVLTHRRKPTGTLWRILLRGAKLVWHVRRSPSYVLAWRRAGAAERTSLLMKGPVNPGPRVQIPPPPLGEVSGHRSAIVLTLLLFSITKPIGFEIVGASAPMLQD